MKRHLLAIVPFTLLVSAVFAQAPAPTFEVVSIKKNQSATATGGARTLPDGSEVITNQPIQLISSG